MEYECLYTKIQSAEWFYKTDLNIFSAPRTVKEKQKMFQIDNGLRVHERGGQGDKVHFHLRFGGYLPINCQSKRSNVLYLKYS